MILFNAIHEETTVNDDAIQVETTVNDIAHKHLQGIRPKLVI